MLTAFTTPSETLTALELLLHVTALFSASSGFTAAVSAALPPTVKSRLVRFRLTLVTRMASALAVRMMFPVTLAISTTPSATSMAVPPIVQLALPSL